MYWPVWLHTVRMTIADAAKKTIKCFKLASIGLLLVVVQPAFANDEPSVQGPLEQQSQEVLSEVVSAASPEILPEQLRGDLVLVAGATGGTGREVIKELLANGYRVRAFVRDVREARTSLGDEVEYAVGDVRVRATVDAALNGVDALISVIGAGRGDPGNGPEFVDYGGVRQLAEAATGLRQFVLVSAAGVTHENNVLNQMFNDVLKWKFKGEQALRASGVPYTIIRPGGLDDRPGGQQLLAFVQGDDQAGIISRADLASICVAALGSAAAVNKTFEVIGSKPPTDNPTDDNFGAAFAGLMADPAVTPAASDEITEEQL